MKRMPKPDRSEYWRKHTFNAWWLPIPSNKYISSNSDMNEKWNHETVRLCPTCNQAYDKEKDHGKYKITYYSQLSKWFKEKECPYCAGASPTPIRKVV